MDKFLAWIMSIFSKKQDQIPVPVVAPKPYPVETAALSLSSARFAAIKYVLENEGGFSNFDVDAGGPTNYGITQNDYSKFLGKNIGVQEVKNMPVSDAIEIYRKNYWTDAYDKLNPAVATCIMDWGVLHGPTRARMLAQQTVGLTPSGTIDENTVSAINRMMPKDFVYKYSDEVSDWMKNRIIQKPSQVIFLKGWLARAARMKTLV